ncbi:hypothetical protein E2C01_013005 [Portunus trituberculatus]|uniref:Uncharacterized protein n=1 Tax=Portunus trituberculatus TaxID=210409 RepID=A0A5B7DG42_PORTR|nr:hypothetical protein [Portunus trituberculatus]
MCVHGESSSSSTLHGCADDPKAKGQMGACYDGRHETRDGCRSVGDAHEGTSQIGREVLMGAHVPTIDGTIETHGYAQHYDSQSLITVHKTHGDQAYHGSIYAYDSRMSVWLVKHEEEPSNAPKQS